MTVIRSIENGGSRKAPPCQVSLLFGFPDNSWDTGRHSENLRNTKEAFSGKLYIDR